MQFRRSFQWGQKKKRSKFLSAPKIIQFLLPNERLPSFKTAEVWITGSWKSCVKSTIEKQYILRNTYTYVLGNGRRCWETPNVWRRFLRKGVAVCWLTSPKRVIAGLNIEKGHRFHYSSRLSHKIPFILLSPLWTVDLPEMYISLILDRHSVLRQTEF